MLGVLEDFHTEDVTQVSFHPTCNTMLISGADDCLVSVFDLNQSDPDETLQTGIY